MNIQNFFNNVCTSLRTHGNQYGTHEYRGWSWCNPVNHNERCAIAQFIPGSSDKIIVNTLLFLLEENVQEINPLVKDVTRLFDTSPQLINNSIFLEKELQLLATKYNLEVPQIEELEQVEELYVLEN